MAKIILGSYMVRYPLGGMMSWVLQYIVGLQKLGHEVYFVEKSGYKSACYDPVKNIMTDNCAYGCNTVNALLAKFNLQKNWCYVDDSGNYYGLSKQKINEIFHSADLFIDMGTHGNWMLEAENTKLRIIIDGEPGFTQMKMEKASIEGKTLPEYDFYYTTGQNIGTTNSAAPTAGKSWRHIFHPVVSSFFNPTTDVNGGAFTTIMNWQSYETVKFKGIMYGHKDIEFEKFVELPKKTENPLEVAVSGIPSTIKERVENAGWTILDAHDVTITYNSFIDFVSSSLGEFSVCKNGYVATNSGWFSDRSAIYLACGRPVVMQETGFSRHLPCGCGLFAVRTVNEAAVAINEIMDDYTKHSQTAREIAEKHLDSSIVLGSLIKDIGL